jgi:hypothetical protein
LYIFSLKQNICWRVEEKYKYFPYRLLVDFRC